MISPSSEQDAQSEGGIDPEAEVRPSESNGGLTKETIFDILSNRRRRHVIRHLRENGSESDLRTLSEQIAAWENSIEPAQVTSKQRMRAYTALRQSHLPKMDRKRVVDFDSQSGSVRLTEEAVSIERYLESLEERSTSWVRLYLGIGGVGLLLSGLCLFDVFPMAGVPDAMAGILISLVVLAIAGTELWQRGAIREQLESRTARRGRN